MTSKKGDYRAYRKRFELVNALEVAELRRLSPEDCMRQVLDLMEFAKAMNWEIHTPDEIETVRQRWRKLKGYGG